MNVGGIWRQFRGAPGENKGNGLRGSFEVRCSGPFPDARRVALRRRQRCHLIRDSRPGTATKRVLNAGIRRRNTTTCSAAVTAASASGATRRDGTDSLRRRSGRRRLRSRGRKKQSLLRRSKRTPGSSRIRGSTNPQRPSNKPIGSERRRRALRRTKMRKSDEQREDHRRIPPGAAFCDPPERVGNLRDVRDGDARRGHRATRRCTVRRDRLRLRIDAISSLAGRVGQGKFSGKRGVSHER